MKARIFQVLLPLFFIVTTVSAQQQFLPVDNKVRYGKLSNGMTYYIRHNKLPEQRADFYIAQRVGSILEEENQRGLAHFLEHMAFNGTANFPDMSLRNYLETVGVKFGENLNAYTSIDETVYMIKNVPTTRQEIIDSCLLILHDWSSFLSLEDEAIDKERGVIREEWRTGNNANRRMYEKVLPEVYGENRYGHRLPIGLISVIDNFKYDELRDYYRTWYRPDLQGIIVVGDIDVDAVENKIKEMFSDIPAVSAKAAERIYYPVEDNKEPIISIASDTEATRASLMVFNKHEPFPIAAKNTEEYLLISYIRNMAASMINDRYREIAQKPDAPFTSASAYDDSFFISETKDAWTSYAGSKEDKIDQTLTVLIRETERVRRFGFTQTEYDRARADLLKAIESAYNERDKEKNAAYVNEYIEHFLRNDPSPGIEFEYRFYNQIANAIPVEVINDYMKRIIDDENVVIVLMMPQKEGLRVPEKEELLAVYNRAKADSIAPYEDKVVDTELVKKMPKPGKIISVVNDASFGATEWLLSNGIVVQFKKTDFKEDQILMRGVSLGGTSLLNEKDMPTIALLGDLITLGGVGSFSKTDLSKALAGKKVGVSPAIGLRTEVINGSCSPSDFETMMQLVYLYFTEPRADKEAFDAYISRRAADLQNAEANPRTSFSDSINKAIYGDNPRGQRFKLEMLDKVDYDLAMKMYKERFMNGDKFVFTFVGNINPDSVAPFIEQYLGALPMVDTEKKVKKNVAQYLQETPLLKGKEMFADVGLNPRKGLYTNIFERKMETEKSSVFIYYSGDYAYTEKNLIGMSMLKQIMDIVYTEKIRENEGGTYGVRVYSDLNKYPSPQFDFQISFDTDPALREKLIPIVYQEIDAIMTDGPREADFNKVKEFMQKKIKENKAENAYWLGVIGEQNYTDTDIATNYENILNSITPEDIKKLASSIFTQGNRVEVVMEPEN